ncbi:hypothetical protein [Aquimonas voraii]|uniref:Uncharacterized protein n=1 Tax=Aquimonas voraii TaxID=265719 RepID=A0A1G6UYC4_9GAMM|nr:hypothetical protein [Aquimonas voraii]SDD46271.1 hypothetical protein SAMN04488509_102552 [Aquimonas voraii]
MQQDFNFAFESPDQLQAFLESLSGNATLEKRADHFYVFTALPGEADFSFDVAIIPQGFTSVRGGAYFHFLGLFVEAVTGAFGPVTISDK